MPGYELRIQLLRLSGFKIGRDVYIGEELIVAEILEEDYEKLVIEDRVAIAPRVTILTSSDANYSHLAKYYPPIQGKVVIKHDAWVGTGAVIFPNVTVGEFAVVGANSVVKKDVEPYTVVAGAPAKVVKKLR
jgi:acetyltransferase-like isoleucine patch superfamily enzyme